MCSLPCPIRHVILDRDGVLNVERDDGGYIENWAQWRWEPGALDALRLFGRLSVQITVATNQSGVGRGILSQTNLDAIHARMMDDAALVGCPIRRVLVCPHSPDSGCACRKPAPGLVLRAIAASGVPSSETVAIGDDLRDLQAAEAAGISFALVRTGKGHHTEQALARTSLPAYDNLYEFATQL